MKQKFIAGIFVSLVALTAFASSKADIPTHQNQIMDAQTSGPILIAENKKSKPTGACYISSGAGNDCFDGLTQQGCYSAASKVGGVADWRESQRCSK